MKLIAISFVSKHHKRPKMQAIDATLDKRSWIRMPFPPIFFFLFYTPVKENILCILRDPAAVCGFISIQSTSQAGDFVVPTVCI